MADLPDDQSINELAALITKFKATDLARRLKNLNTRARRGGNPNPDGHRASTMPGAGGGPTITVPDEHGNPDTIPVTSVEAAVVARLGPARPDPLNAAIKRAYSQLQAAATALDLFAITVAAAENVQAEPIDNRARCWCMYRVGVDEQAKYRIHINGETRHVGRWAYDFWRTTIAEFGPELARLPTKDECEARARGDRIMVRQIPRSA